jgi:hypothetical protein
MGHNVAHDSCANVDKNDENYFICVMFLNTFIHIQYNSSIPCIMYHSVSHIELLIKN